MSQTLFCSNCKNERTGHTIYTCQDCEKEFCSGCKSRYLSAGIICPHCQGDNWKERANAVIVENNDRPFANAVTMKVLKGERDKKVKTKHLQLVVLGLLICLGASFLWDMSKLTIGGVIGFWGLVAGVIITIKHSALFMRSLPKK